MNKKQKTDLTGKLKEVECHKKISELANLADSIYDNEFGGRVHFHLPIYAGSDLLEFVKERYGASHFSIDNVTYYLLPFTFSERNDFEEIEMEVEPFGNVIVKYTENEAGLLQEIVSIQNESKNELLHLFSEKYLSKIRHFVKLEIYNNE